MKVETNFFHVDVDHVEKEMKTLRYGGMIHLIFNVIIAKDLIIASTNVKVSKKIEVIHMLKL